MLTTRDAIEKVGIMPECYFLYYEELDWSMMFTRAGYTILYDPCCTIYHKESQATGQNSPTRTYYITRNRFLFAQRNLTPDTRLLTYAYLMCIVLVRDILKDMLQWRGDLIKAALSGVRDFIIGQQGKQLD